MTCRKHLEEELRALEAEMSKAWFWTKDPGRAKWASARHAELSKILEVEK